MTADVENKGVGPEGGLLAAPRSTLRDKRGLTPLERLFVSEYIAAGFNAAEAIRRVTPNCKTAREYGYDMLRRPHVAAAVLAALEERERAAGITAEKLLREVHDIAFVDPADFFDPDTGTLLPIREMPPAARKAIASIDVEELYGRGPDGEKIAVGRVKKIRLVSKESMITLAGKHLSLFHDRVKVDGNISYKIVTGVPDGDG